MTRKLLLAMLPLMQCVAFQAIAEEKTPCDKIPDKIVGECFKVHGRLSFYNGTPSFRIWVIGTHHLLNVTDWWAKSHAEELPENVRKLLPTDDFISTTKILGDYEVCPLEKEHSGWAQSVCIASASHLYVDKK
jgi:hypothetical protein